MHRGISAIAFLILTMSPAPGGEKDTKVAVDLHAHRAEIRQFLLRQTPIGSTSSDVSEVCCR